MFLLITICVSVCAHVCYISRHKWNLISQFPSLFILNSNHTKINFPFIICKSHHSRDLSFVSKYLYSIWSLRYGHAYINSQNCLITFLLDLHKQPKIVGRGAKYDSHTNEWEKNVQKAKQSKWKKQQTITQWFPGGKPFREKKPTLQNKLIVFFSNDQWLQYTYIVLLRGVICIELVLAWLSKSRTTPAT